MRYERPKERIDVDFNIPDEVDLPPNTLLAITFGDGLKEFTYESIECLKGKKKRDWFIDHAYFCLPLTMANQHGFIVKAATDFAVYWNGGDEPEDVTVSLPEDYTGPQAIKPHFGMGTVTITNPWIVRTPKGVNTLVLNPPNMYIHGIIHMSACVETDQLRRDFTFNLRVTKPEEWFHVRKGDPVGYMLPYPRHFIDNYKLVVDEEGIKEDTVESERTTSFLFGQERAKIDSNYAGGVGGRYMRGEDIYGNKLPDHQKTLGGGKGELEEKDLPLTNTEQSPEKEAEGDQNMSDQKVDGTKVSEEEKEKPKCPFGSLFGSKK